MFRIGKIFLCAAILASSTAFAEPTVTVVVTPNPLHEDDSLQLRIEVQSENAGEIGNPSFDAPDFTQVGSSSSTSVSSEYANGKISMVQKVIYTYILLPTKQGQLKISNIGVEVSGKQLRSNDKMVNVLPPGGGGPTPSQPAFPQEEEDADGPNPAAPQADNGGPGRLNSDFTVHVQVNKTSAYVGEPIVAEYWIYDFGGLQSVDVQKWPTFNGFWKEDLQIATRYQFQDTFVHNQHVRKALLGRFALYAIKPGKLPVDQLVITGKYVSRNRYNQLDDAFSLFLGNLGQLRTAVHGSESVSINVLPLPEQGRPSSFGGAVGKFKMNLAADKQSAQANTPINLSLTIEGKGNFQAIDQFKLPLPADFELYESNASVNGSAPLGTSRSLENRKVFHYLVLPRKAGKYTIPAIEWSYFDPEKKQYQSLSTSPVNLDISPDDGSHVSNIYGGPGGVGATATPHAENSPPPPEAKLELRYLKPTEDFQRAPFPLGKLINISLVLANLFLLGFVLLRGLRRSNPLLRMGQAPKRRLTQLVSRVETHSKNRSEHFSSLENAVQEVLETLLNKPSVGMTREEIEREWQEQQRPPELFGRIQSLLDLADKERYSRNKDSDLETSLKKRNLEELRSIVAKATALI